MIFTILLGLCLAMLSFSYMKDWDKSDKLSDLCYCLCSMIMAFILCMTPYEHKTQEYIAKTVSETKVYVPETKKVYITDTRMFENTESVKILVHTYKHVLFGERESQAEIVEKLR
jgi:hypothetical protein